MFGIAATLALAIVTCSASIPSINVTVTFPTSQPVEDVVFSNFMGISIELSAIDSYIGENTSLIPQPMLNYMDNIRTRAKRPLRFRIGGNSMDSSVYVPTQSNMITLTGGNSSNDITCTFGPVLFDVLKAVGNNIGGSQYILGLSLLNAGNPNVPVLASAAEQRLGDQLDAFLLGNEPDLYFTHGERPLVTNYTVDDYLEDFGNTTNELTSSTDGNLLSQVRLGGPSICCLWDLDTLLQGGYLSMFSDTLKYISLQHYPQDNCNNTHPFGIDYYLQHQLVVQLASWQLPGIRTAQTSDKEIIMGEFNSASCGGIPGISDTFAATIWTVDYVLQMALSGYSAAYIHTRERGVTYNLFDSPVPGNGTDWTTLPSYYALLPVVEALGLTNGSFIHDLNLDNSTVVNGTVAGYAIYDGQTGSASRLVLFNYADSSAGVGPAAFTLPEVPDDLSKSGQIFVRHLTAPSTTETTQISWGGQTLASVGDGKMIASKMGSDEQLLCQNGCTVNVPSPGLVVVWLDAMSSDILKPLANGTLSDSYWLSTIFSLWTAVIVTLTIAFVL